MMVFRRDLSSISGFFRSHFRYSTATPNGISPATQNTHANFLVDYLINSLGFSKEAAISASSNSKVKTHLKSAINPDLVVNLLKDYGLEKTQINDIVSSVPQILTFKANETLEPKLGVLRDLGLSGSDLAKFIKNRPSFFHHGLDTTIMPMFDYLRKLLGSHEKATAAALRSLRTPLFYSHKALKRMQDNVLLLQNHGVPIDKIGEIIVRNPRCIQSRTEDVEKGLFWVQEELGMSCDSAMFSYALDLSLSFNKSLIEEKMQVFRSFGWSHSEVASLVRAHPPCLMSSTALIRDKLKFLMTDLKYTPFYLIKCHSLFTYSLEKRVKPRYEILKILKEKKLVKEKPNFVSLATYSEQNFLKFVRRFETEVPSLFQTYTDSIKNTSK